jgi:hypothetical protein
MDELVNAVVNSYWVEKRRVEKRWSESIGSDALN